MLQNQFIADVTSFELNKAITFSGFFDKIKLKSCSRLVLRCLVDFWNPKKGCVYPKQRTVAKYTGCSRGSVGNAVKELKSLDIIETDGDDGDVLEYTFTAKFFELLKIGQGCTKFVQGGAQNLSNMNKGKEQIKNILPFKKNQSNQYDTRPKGMEYQDLEAPNYQRDARTPENDLETAQNFIQELLPMQNNPLVKAKLDKILEIWGYDKFGIVDYFNPLNSSSMG